LIPINFSAMPQHVTPPIAWLSLWARAEHSRDDLARLSLCAALPDTVRASDVFGTDRLGSDFTGAIERCTARILSWAATLIPESCIPVVSAAVRLAQAGPEGAGDLIGGLSSPHTLSPSGVMPEAAFCLAAVIAGGLANTIVALQHVHGIVPPTPSFVSYRGLVPPPTTAEVAATAAAGVARATASSAFYAWLIMLLASEVDPSIAAAEDARRLKEDTLPGGTNEPEAAASVLAALLRVALASKAAVVKLSTVMILAAGRPCAEVLLLQVCLRVWERVEWWVDAESSTRYVAWSVSVNTDCNLPTL
jgi:hypothetical protein